MGDRLHLVSIRATDAAKYAFAANWMEVNDKQRSAYLANLAWESLEKAAEAFGAKLVKVEQAEDAA